MIAVIGSFRFPPEQVDQALPLMKRVIAETLREEGCHAYSYAQDVTDPGLFRVTEIWADREALDRHFRTDHMLRWSKEREGLGFHDRDISIFPLEPGEQI